MRISDWSSDVCSSDLALALADKSRHLRPVRVDIANDAGLNAKSILQAADGVLPARTCVAAALGIGAGQRNACIFLAENLVDLLTVVGDEIGSAHVGTPVDNAHLLCRFLPVTNHK